MVAGTVLLIAAVLFAPITHADHPVTATGIALQTLAGMLAAVQLWANNASDSLVRWTARQVEANRWRIAGLFDGRLRSLLIAAAWYLLGFGALRLLASWNPPAILGWLVAIPIALVAVAGALVLVLAFVMFGAALLVSDESLPDGRALTALEAHLNGNDWIWPLVGLAVLIGGFLQVAAA